MIQQIITWSCVILLCAASAEDKKYHRVHRKFELEIFLLGIFRLCVTEDNRWVTISLTCFCFLLWYLLYLAAGKKYFGGADVRLMTACMPALGENAALQGAGTGFLMAGVYYILISRKRTAEIPLIPWLTIGIIVREIMQKMIYFL